jgi:DNA-directed RNA polymerase subunit RPC12/RpoP
MKAKIEANLEYLYHYKCKQCLKWWTVGDICPFWSSTEPGAKVYCPHCGSVYEVIGVVSHSQAPQIKRIEIRAQTTLRNEHEYS